MNWLFVVILAYFLFAVVSLVDRRILKGPPNAKIYAFYVGILGILSLLLAPFVGFFIPELHKIIFCLFAGIIYFFALFSLFSGLEKFEASRIIPAVGGFLPIFTLLLVYSFSDGKESLNYIEILAFLFLVLGSVVVSWQTSFKISFEALAISFLSAFFLSLSLILAKNVYLALPFWTGFLWIRVGAFLSALFFLFLGSVRKEIFSGASAFSRKTGALFIFNQGIGAGAFILQNWAIALAGLAYLSIINALQGIQYVFLFILAALFLKESLSKKIIIQKVAAILLIGAGLAILTI